MLQKAYSLMKKDIGLKYSTRRRPIRKFGVSLNIVSISLKMNDEIANFVLKWREFFSVFGLETFQGGKAGRNRTTMEYGRTSEVIFPSSKASKYLGHQRAKHKQDKTNWTLQQLCLYLIPSPNITTLKVERYRVFNSWHIFHIPFGKWSIIPIVNNINFKKVRAVQIFWMGD